MRDPKVDEILRRALPGQNVNENGRAPLLRHIAADEVLILEKFRAMDVGHGPGVDDGIPAAPRGGDEARGAKARRRARDHRPGPL